MIIPVGYRSTLLADIISCFDGSGFVGSVPVYDQRIAEQSTWGIPLDLQLTVKIGWHRINPQVNVNARVTDASLTVKASFGSLQ
jgi:hypothetical protein